MISLPFTFHGKCCKHIQGDNKQLLMTLDEVDTTIYQPKRFDNHLGHNSLLANIWLKDIQFSSSPIFLISSITDGIQSNKVCLSFFCLLFSLVDGTECNAVFDFFAFGLS